MSYVVLPRGELLDSGEPIGRVASNGRVYGSDGELKFCWTANGALLDAAGGPTGTTLHGNEVRWISDPSPGAIEPVTVSVSAEGNRLLVKSSKPAVPSKHGTAREQTEVERQRTSLGAVDRSIAGFFAVPLLSPGPVLK